MTDLTLVREVFDKFDGTVTANYTTLVWLANKIQTFKPDQQDTLFAESQLTEIHALSLEDKYTLSSLLAEMKNREAMSYCIPNAFDIRVNVMKRLKDKKTYVAETSAVGTAQASTLPNLTVDDRHVHIFYLPKDGSHYISHESVLPVLFSHQAERPISNNIAKKLCDIMGAHEEAGAVESSILTKPSNISSFFGEWGLGSEMFTNPPNMGVANMRTAPFVAGSPAGISAKEIIVETNWQSRYHVLEDVSHCDNLSHETRGKDSMMHGIYMPALWLRYAYVYCYEGEWATVGTLNHADIQNEPPLYLPIGLANDGEQEVALKMEAIMLAYRILNNQQECGGNLTDASIWPIVGLKPMSIRLLLSSLKLNDTGRLKKLDSTIYAIETSNIHAMSGDDMRALVLKIIIDVANELKGTNNELSKLFQRHIFSAFKILALAHEASSVNEDNHSDILSKVFLTANTTLDDDINIIADALYPRCSSIYSNALSSSSQALLHQLCNIGAIAQTDTESNRLGIPVVQCTPWAHLCTCCSGPMLATAAIIDDITRSRNGASSDVVSLSTLKVSFCYKGILDQNQKSVVVKHMTSATVDMYALIWEENFYMENVVGSSRCMFKDRCVGTSDSIIWTWEDLVHVISNTIMRNWKNIGSSTFANAVMLANTNVEWNTLQPSQEEAYNITNAVLLGCIARGTVDVPNKSFEGTLAYITRRTDKAFLHEGIGCKPYVAIPRAPIDIPHGMPSLVVGDTTWFLISDNTVLSFMKGNEESILVSSPRYTSTHATDMLKKTRVSDITNIFLNEDGVPSKSQFVHSTHMSMLDACKVGWYNDAVESRVPNCYNDFLKTMLQLDRGGDKELKIFRSTQDLRYPADEATDWLKEKRFAIREEDNHLIIYRIAHGIDIKYELKAQGSLAFVSGGFSIAKDTSESNKWEQMIYKASCLRDIIRSRSPDLEAGKATEYASMLLLLASRNGTLGTTTNSIYKSLIENTSNCKTMIEMDLPLMVGKSVEYHKVERDNKLIFSYRLSTNTKYNVCVDSSGYIRDHDLPIIYSSMPLTHCPASSTKDLANKKDGFVTSNMLAICKK